MGASNRYGFVKTMSEDEFFGSPQRVKTLRAGQSLAVTDKGRASFIVTKVKKCPRKTLADLEREAAEIFPDRRGPLDIVQGIIDLRTGAR